MAKISLNGYELSYSFNGVSKSAGGVSVLLIHGAGGQEVDWPLAWRSLNDLTRSLGLTPKEHGGGLDNYPVYAIDLPGHGKSGGKSQIIVEKYADAITPHAWHWTMFALLDIRWVHPLRLVRL